MITLGAFLSVCQILHASSVVKALTNVLPERYHHLIDINRRALERGDALVVDAVTPLV